MGGGVATHQELISVSLHFLAPSPTIVFGLPPRFQTGDCHVGFDLGWIDFANKRHMASLAVEPSWQLCGVGRALVDQAERSAMEAGYSCITLEVEATNTAALALYTSGGYEQVDCDENGRKLVGDVFFGKSKRVCKLTLEKSLE